MTPDEIVQIINQTGFPIVASAALFYLCNTTIKQNTDILQEVNKTLALLVTHMEESA